jgi:hypothetical protein
VIFWVERSVVRRYREEHPELDNRSSSPVAR